MSDTDPVGKYTTTSEWGVAAEHRVGTPGWTLMVTRLIFREGAMAGVERHAAHHGLWFGTRAELYDYARAVGLIRQA
ncbi:hypothetical protein [Streptomyces sp. MNP-20]|uniref:hypothetical protein n=1 Tax=Streptomyces sp. MNP-20 TaxID=2721165 RepID=UPI0015522A02|nr:hypothetical protein [Streptomyces sp. MNP-20]